MQNPPAVTPPVDLAAGQNSTTVTIDPSQTDAIQLEPAVAGTGAAPPEATGPVAKGMENLLPETGSKAVDQSVDTFTRAVGGMIDRLIAHLPEIVIALLVLIFTAFVASFASRAVRRLTGRLRIKENLQDLFAKLTYIAVWFFGLVAAAGIVFPGLGMGELVATAGLASIAIGFAFQDILENFLAGMIIIWKFPFNDGDFIDIPSEDVMGRVEEVQIRMTHIRSVTGELVLVPNATIYKNVVRVLTNRPARRMTVICGLAYQEDVATGRRVIREAVESCESVDRDHPIEIFAQEFASSSINFEVTWWTGPTPLEQRRSRDEVVEKVKAALDNAGIEIPYPYRTLVFTRNEPDIINAVAGKLPEGGGED